MVSTTTFIYALCEPGTRTIRYIGKADKPSKRFKQHLRDSVREDTHLGRWLSSLKDLPAMLVLREIPYEQWQIAEERYIRLARGLGMKLVNGTDGGDGVTMTPETISKIRAGNLGKSKSPEHCAAIGRGHKGILPSVESRAKMSAAKKGRPMNPAQKASAAALAVFNTGKPKSPAHRSAISKALTGVKLSPEHRAAIGACRKGKPLSPAHIAKLRGRKLSEEHRAKIRIGMLALRAAEREYAAEK